jgi:hypothetical protein
MLILSLFNRSQRMYVNIINRKFGRQNITIDVTMNLHYSFVIIKLLAPELFFLISSHLYIKYE